jgi:ATP-binding protein involved in chromosome partitioning
MHGKERVISPLLAHALGLTSEVPSKFDTDRFGTFSRCALCRDEMSGRPLLDPKSVRADIAPRTISSVGNYAIQIAWNDGHNTGIDTFTHLRALGDSGAAEVAEDV